MSLTSVHKQSCMETRAPFSIGDFPPELCKNVCPCSALSEQGLATTVASKKSWTALLKAGIYVATLKKKNVTTMYGKKKLQLFCQTCAHSMDRINELRTRL